MGKGSPSPPLNTSSFTACHSSVRRKRETTVNGRGGGGKFFIGEKRKKQEDPIPSESDHMNTDLVI